MGSLGFSLPNISPEGSDPGSPLVQNLMSTRDRTNSLLPQFLQAGAQQGNLGRGLIGQAQGLAAPAGGFMQQFLNPSHQMLSQLFNPAKQAMADATQAKTQEIANTAPRGGGKNSEMAKLPYQQIGAQNQLYGQAPQLGFQAASGLSGLAGMFGNLGTSQTGQGIQQQGLGLSANEQVLQSLLGQRQQNTSTDNNNRSLLTQGLGQMAGLLL